MKLSEIKRNPNNPRLIKDEKFKKLVKSIEDFPKMMALRPMIIDENNIVLGGNMRLKALKELGYKEIPDDWIKRADELTEEEQRRFIIADNVGFGEHDWEMLKAEWDVEELDGWGLHVPDWSLGVDANNMTDDDVDIEEEFDPIGISSGMQRVVFLFNDKEHAENYLNSISVKEYSKKGQAWQVNMNSQSI